MNKAAFLCFGAVFGALITFFLLPRFELGIWISDPLAIEKRVFADGSMYTGEVNELGQLHGKGRLEQEGGYTYVGMFADGLFHGEGSMSYASGGRYQGDFVAGMASGLGLLEYADGSVYEGEFKQDVPHGSGVINFANGNRYAGEFVEGEMQGQGVWTIVDMHEYSGEIANDGQMHGLGVIKYVGGASYTGMFENDQMHGAGLFKTADGTSYSGNFVQGSFEGQGTLTAEGGSYTGEFKNWLGHGEGLKVDKAGNRWSGQFESGELNGLGKFVGTNGERYEGMFENSLYHGEGHLHEVRGNQYIGTFVNGRKHGSGRYVLAEALDGVSEYTGIWEWGTLVEGDENYRVYGPEEIAEHALYNQVDALERAFQGVRVGTQDKPELYVLALAGWGKEDVFYRELNYLNSLFDRLFGTKHHSISLMNSKRSYADYPLATVESIRRSIMHIAEKMNLEEDILFLYATSHGTPDDGFALSSRGISLSDLTPAELKAMLEESKIKYSVLVVSACYSGIFADEISGDNIMMVTAAASDKTSFGCSDERAFTYFGQAFLEQSVEQFPTFLQAFEHTRKKVLEWEERDGFTPSEPVIQAGSDIQAQLAKWRSTLP